MNSTNKSHDNRITARFLVFSGAVLLIFGLIIVQYLFLMVINQDGDEAPYITMPTVERGPILDRNGKILAHQTKLSSLAAWKPQMDDINGSARLLGDILSLDEEALITKFNSHKGYFYIKRKITNAQHKAVFDLKEQDLLKGIILEPHMSRTYPGRKLASHVLGYVDIDNIGIAGVEYAWNQELTPPLVYDTKKTIYGNQVFLTLDLNIQYFIEKIAEETYNQYDAKSVMIMVADARNGEILGYAVKPDFDPNNYNDFENYPVSSRVNRPISVAYEPGSVFKVFSVASLLESGAITPESSFFCGGAYINDKPQKDIVINCLGVHGDITTEDILIHSCNSGAGFASDELGQKDFYRMLENFGFGKTTGISLQGESIGVLNKTENWSLRSKPTIAMGQEIGVSAIQIVSAATALTNGGMLLKPHIVKKIVSPDGRVLKEYEREPVREVLSPETAYQVLGMMEKVTWEGGSARRAAIEGMRVSAKTGTAEVIDTETGKYSEDKYIASCLAIYPTDDPKIISYVVIEHPKSENYFGGTIAAPLIGKIGEYIIPYLDIPRSNEIVVDHSGEIYLTQVDQIEPGAELPDLTGVSKRQLLPLLSRGDLVISITGEGWVVRQNPPPGTLLKPGMNIELELE